MAKDRRIVVEHKDGRRLTVAEDDFNDEQANPYNYGGNIQSFDIDRGVTTVEQQPARPMDDHKSLKAEGFKPVMAIHGAKHTKECPYEADVCPGEGAEIPLEKD